jgi:hypothetical protein
MKVYKNKSLMNISAMCLSYINNKFNISWQSMYLLTVTYGLDFVDQVCQWLATGQWFSSVTPVPSTNKTDRHDITEILLKVALNQTNQP